eukprot:1345411-Pyramimonas_sp.AAC.4
MPHRAFSTSPLHRSCCKRRDIGRAADLANSALDRNFRKSMSPLTYHRSIAQISYSQQYVVKVCKRGVVDTEAS